MHRTKITTFIGLTAVSAFLLVLSFTPRAGGAEPGPVTADFIGIGGMAFQAGENVDVKWSLQGAGVKYFESHNWSECELYFSADGSKTWTRITPQLSVSRRNWEWTAPNVSTEEGVIALRIGIEGEADYYMFLSDKFAVQ